MRRLLALMLALALLPGCGLLPGKDKTPSHDAQFPARAVAAHGETVYLDVALIERPASDAYLDREVWDSSDEQGVGLEIKPALEENGLRIGQFGMLPDKLQTLLASPRTCAEPRRLRGEPGKAISVVLGKPRSKSDFTVRLAGESKPLALSRTRCEFEVLATPTDDGRIRLRFTPRVKHGDPHMQPRVARDPDGQLRWAVEPTEPAEEFAELRFEVCLTPGEYLAMGTRADQAGTLGHAFFLPEGGHSGRYLLVLRAGRIAGSDETDDSPAPLALRATGSASRGTSR